MNESISRLMDGEIDDAELQSVMAGLKRPDGLATWACYHAIGDTHHDAVLARCHCDRMIRTGNALCWAGHGLAPLEFGFPELTHADEKEWCSVCCALAYQPKLE